MGIAAFQWGENELTLLLSREKCVGFYECFDVCVYVGVIKRTITPADWDKNEILLRGRPQDNMGTWFGISKKGRVAFSVDQMTHKGFFLWGPIVFLREEVSPEVYAKEVSGSEEGSRDLTYEMIVADINTNSMYHISKKKPDDPKVDYKEVGFGVHTLSLFGLDRQFPKESRMQALFNEIIDVYKNEPLEEMAKKFIYDPPETEGPSEIDEGKEAAKAMSTTALVVKKPTKEVMFCERYFEDGDWKDNKIDFKME